MRPLPQYEGRGPSSSGSFSQSNAGTPKPLIYTHEWVSRCFGSTTIPTTEDIVDFGHYIASGSLFLALPPFHVSGVHFFAVN
jgi:hypothetical protein